jgi:hypothetical protein
MRRKIGAALFFGCACAQPRQINPFGQCSPVGKTPVHVIQALLGHASPDTVMIYAKLYPSQLIEEYRKTVRSLYNAYYGEGGLKNPTAEEWAAFAASCNLRDMGTHLCASEQ